MRGPDEASGALFSHIDLEARIPVHPPLRKFRQVVNEALASLAADFSALYGRATGRFNAFPYLEPLRQTADQLLPLATPPPKKERQTWVTA